MTKKVLSFAAHKFSIAAFSVFSILSSNAIAQVSGEASGIDLVALRNLAGVENVDGSGASVLQVEAGSQARDDMGNVIGENYTPNLNDGFFTTNNFNDIGSPQSTGSLSHATTVGRVIYGSRTTDSPVNRFGVAPGVGSAGTSPIETLSANQFLNSHLGGGSSEPQIQTQDVSNHSYIFKVSNDTRIPLIDRIAAIENTLTRLDYTINEGNTTTVAGTGGANTAATTGLPAGLVQAYNTINVGLSNGTHAAGLTTLNTEGRIAIHVVADQTAPSYTTAVVSGGAAILHQTGAGTDAVKQEVIKATILAGATKDDLSGPWTRTPDQPLDLVYGAGEINVLNNHNIQQGGEFDGSTSDPVNPVGLNGWDYEPSLATGEERFYEFSVVAGQKLNDLSIVLTWNLNVEDSTASRFTWVPTTSLADLSLELYDSSTGFLAAMIDSSDSAVDNVEHIYISDLSPGTYHLRVANNATASFDTDFGLAFRSTAVLLGDIDRSGVVNFQDIAPFVVFTYLGRLSG